MSAPIEAEGRLITSLTNDTVKAVRALHMRKEREATGLFLAEGLKFIGEALDQGRAPRTLLVGMEARPHPLLDRAKTETIQSGGEVVTVTHPILEKISRRDNPQTVLGVFDQVFTPLSARPRMGILTLTSQAAAIASVSPACSLPIRIRVGRA